MRLRAFGGLWIENLDADSDAGPRPRQLALLAMLAVTGEKGLSRDGVLGVLWPEAEEERARQSLSQVIYSLKRDLGIDVAASGARLRLDERLISSDVADFKAAVAAKNWQGAAALYVGPFLDGFYLADAPEFERWTESERASLATEGIRAIEVAAKASADAGHRDEAAEFWRRLTATDPANSRAATSYIEALAALGDRSAALAHGKAHADYLRREFDAEPSRAFQQALERIREYETREHAAVGTRNTEQTRDARLETRDVATSSPGPATSAANVPKRRPRGSLVAAGIAAIVLLGIVGWRAATGRSISCLLSRVPCPVSQPVLAVGRIRDLVAPESVAVSAVLSEMLATSLGRLTDLQVVANSRMLELTPRGRDTSQSVLADAARRAGATEIIEGELIPLPNRQLRLEIRRVDMTRGLVRRGYRVSGSDRVALFDSVTALVAADFRMDAPSGSLAEITTRSPIAYRFYEEGLRAYYVADLAAARRLFQSALREDSTFAMATFYAWRVAIATSQPDEGQLASRAVALASHSSPRDRLLILTYIGAAHADMRAIAAAETLSTNYGRDPEVLIAAAEVTRNQSRAVEFLNRAIALDSAANPTAGIACHLCDALSHLTGIYEWADSGEAVVRTLDRWHRLRPNDAVPWRTEADWLIGLGRRAEGEAAIRRYEALGGTRGSVHLDNLVQNLRLDDLDAVDAACETGLATADGGTLLLYRWFCVIALRMEGRYREALALAREGKVPKLAVVRKGMPRDPFLDGVLDMESGHPLAAADVFAGIRPPGDGDGPGTGVSADARTRTDSVNAPAGLRARSRTWALTLSATAAVAGGDTLRARRLVDSIETLGRGSPFPRDPLIHHFVRGLLLSRAHHDEAALSEFRAAIHSPTFGYTRINYEIAQTALSLKRPKEAIPLVQAALHGGIEGAGLYVTRTELHETLARLFDADHQRDSAAAHYAVVERSWRSADSFLKPRYEAARQHVAR
ncbi:MAG TPA: BTAD domain-containing putative transcriptional regulator [Gemmatimonadaceae bacterium]|nr:BTAD domain-containing putative transcriptional regulator [Gemmatimonadaceae bacterium]